MQRRTGNCGKRRVFVRLECHLELALFFATVDGEHAVALQAAHRLGKVVVHGIGRVRLIRAGCADDARAVQQCAQATAQVCVVRQVFRNDIARARKRVRGGLHALVRGDKGRGQRFECGGRRARCGDGRREWLQPFFARNGGAGAPLGTVRAVQVVQRSQRFRPGDGGLERIGQLALRLDRFTHLGAALVQST